MTNTTPAFPNSTATQIYSQGMTLRDYFASKAMQFIGSPNPKTGQFATPSEFYAIADQAYAMADEMMKVRVK